jgi:hypothetical protein
MSGCAFVWFCSRPTRVHEAQPSNPNAAAMLRQALHDMPLQRASNSVESCQLRV